MKKRRTTKKPVVRYRTRTVVKRARRKRKAVKGFGGMGVNPLQIVGGGAYSFMGNIENMLPANIPFLKPALFGIGAIMTDKPAQREWNALFNTLLGVELGKEAQKMIANHKMKQTEVEETPTEETPTSGYLESRPIFGMREKEMII